MDVRSGQPLQVIKFDYLPESPFEHGWKPIEGREQVQFLPIEDPDHGRIMRIKTEQDFCMDYHVGVLQQACKAIGFVVRSESNFAFYAIIKVRGQQIPDEVRLYCSSDIEGSYPEQHPEYQNEYKVYVPVDQLKNRWTLMKIDLPQKVREVAAVGDKDWEFNGLLILRLKGSQVDIDCARIELYKESPWERTFSYDVFVSYSHADRVWVWVELLPRLEGAGLRVCIDDRDFEIGVPSLINMERAVDSSRHTLVVLTPAWIKSEWTEFESLLVGTADPAGRRRKLIPLMLKSCKLPTRIAMLTYADFTRPLEHEVQMVRLVRSLGSTTEILSHPEPSEQRSQAVTAPNPFGDTGRITDPDRFFGREELLRQIFEELGKGVNLSLVGESQVGKSSLLSMVCALGPERMGLPSETFAYLSLEWVDDEDDFYEALCEALGIETCRGYKLTRALRGKRYVLCLDEIEKMTWDGFTVRLRSQLRGLADGPAAPLKLVIASRSSLAHLFPDSPELDSPLAGICRQLDVGPFPSDVARAFLGHRLGGTGVTFAESEITALLAKTGGHPAKLQRAAANLYRRKGNLPESSELSGR